MSSELELEYTDPDEIRSHLKKIGGYTSKWNPEVQAFFAMTMDEISNMSLDEVTNAIGIIGQTLLYLDGEHKVYKVQHMRLKQEYERHLAEALEELRGPGKDTKGERVVKAHRTYPILDEIRNRLDLAEISVTLLEDQAKYLGEFSNSLKKKHETLISELQNMYRTIGS